jgi:hypothetical protein
MTLPDRFLEQDSPSRIDAMAILDARGIVTNALVPGAV